MIPKRKNEKQNQKPARSRTYDNPIWRMLDQMDEKRPYKASDFKKEYFLPDI